MRLTGWGLSEFGRVAERQDDMSVGQSSRENDGPFFRRRIGSSAAGEIVGTFTRRERQRPRRRMGSRSSLDPARELGHVSTLAVPGRAANP
jgi:hypothetical protein